MSSAGSPPGRDLEGLRILGFCDHFTETPGGGAEIVTMQVYRILRSHGAEVEVVSVVPGVEPRSTTVYGIPTHVVAGRDLSRIFKAQLTISRRVTSVGRSTVLEFRPDVLHASSIHFRSSLAVARIGRSMRLPLVTTAHVGSVQALPPVTRAATALYEQTIGRFILRASDRVIAVSEDVANHVTSRGARSDRTTVIHNGVDHELFRPRPAPEDRLSILFLGRLIKNKGPMEALQAFARLESSAARLAFAGDGPMRSQLVRAAARLGVADSVTFLGRVDDIPDLLATSDVLIRPSHTEGQSLAILEAMASGVCVIASNIPANTALIEHEVTGLLAQVENAGDLTKQLARATADRSLRERLAEAGHEQSLTYSWERCAAETGEVLAAAAGRPR
jgi:glycosyltransferase involved in cell wall biosynthesis